ncbi:MAG: AAA family ATPase [Gemmatimonadota bacterium]|nr:AAA family ATPase [Gemmatimonadota bacterium]
MGDNLPDAAFTVDQAKPANSDRDQRISRSRLIVEGLLRPDITLIETHISWILLDKTDVWKIKKPLSLGFLDFSTLQKRRQACQAEVRLNRRTAASVYIGVVPVTIGPTGCFEIDGPGETVEWAVHMLRLPDDRRGDIMLERGRITTDHIENLAERIAGLHADARTGADVDKFGAVRTIRFNIEENFEQTHDFIAEFISHHEAREIEERQRAFVKKHKLLFSKRIRDGRTREGHGDLRLEHVYYMENSIEILDCIEFNDRFRSSDVCADIAFMTMDLVLHHRTDLAEQFLAAYARHTSDFEIYRLIDFYQSYRAYVRGKVDAFLATDRTVPTKTAEAAANRARSSFLLALASELEPLTDGILIAIGGKIASGKSTVANALGRRLSCPTISSDRIRKAMIGVSPTKSMTQPPWQGLYDPKTTARVYNSIMEHAGSVLGSGRTAILDATFQSRRYRELARKTAEKHRVRFIFIECRAQKNILEDRLKERMLQPTESDARLDTLEALEKTWEPPDELPDDVRLKVDTGADVESCVTSIQTYLDPP